MDFTKCPTREELAAYIREQHDLCKRCDLMDKKLSTHITDVESWKAYALELETHRLTEEGRKSNEAWEELTKAVAYANEHFSEAHCRQISKTAGISKAEWHYLSHPGQLRTDIESLIEANKK